MYKMLQAFSQFSVDKRGNNTRDRITLFLIGLFSLTQIRIGAKIGISEIFMVLFLPFLYLKDHSDLRRNGFSTMLNLAILWIGAAIISDWVNGSEFLQTIRGFSVPVVIMATIVTLHHFLKNDIRNYKWVLLGLACSQILSIFVFQRGTAGDLAAEGDFAGAVEKMLSYKLFWNNMITTWVLLPIQTIYLKLPLFVSIFGVSICAISAILSGGRSAFLGISMGLALICLGRKNQDSMRTLKRHIIFVIILLVCLGFCVKSGYKYAATHGWLNEYETRKFESQTASGDSILRLLMAGRGEFFIGCFAIADKPILGHGSWAQDDRDYTKNFLMDYGSEEDVRNLINSRALNEYTSGKQYPIPVHSHITTAWVWHGIGGALFWIYLAYLAVRVLFKCLHVVPEMYGYLALAIPPFAFDILFSPFGLRTGECLFFTILCLISNAEKRIASRI